MADYFKVTAPSADLVAMSRGHGAETLVLLHGGLGWPDYLEQLADILSPSYQVVTFDQRGVGLSTSRTGRFDVEDELRDIEALRAALKIERLHLLGHDRGGVLAQLYALRHSRRVLSLVLLNSGLGTRREWDVSVREAERHLRRRSSAGRGLTLGAWSLAGLAGPWADTTARRIAAVVWRSWFSDPSLAVPLDERWFEGVRARAGRLQDKALRAAGRDLPGRWETVFPMLVLYGDDDVYGPSAQDVVRLRFPRASQFTLTECGHLPWLEAPDACAALLRHFYEVPEAAAA
jgi:proline iminopeptidase